MKTRATQQIYLTQPHMGYVDFWLRLRINAPQFFDSVLVQAHEYKYAVMVDASSSM